MKSTAADWVQVSRLEQPTMPVLDLYKRRQVLFKVTLRGSEDTAEELHQEPVNSFAVMMANTRKAARWEFLPPPLDNPINGVQRLFNKLLTYARRAKCGFRGDFPIVDMAKTLSAVATAFFCLTSFEEQLFSQHVATACKAPTSFREFCGFSAAAEGSHKKKPALDQDTCKSTAAALVDLTISHPTLNNAVWTPLREMRDALVSCLQQRQQHLAGQSSKAQERQRSQFVQSFENGSVVSHYSAIPYSEDVKTEYDSLNETLCNQPYYEPLPLVDYLPAAAAAGENLSMKKNRWLELLGVQCDIYLLRWLPGGQKEAQYWAIRVDKEAVSGNVHLPFSPSFSFVIQSLLTSSSPEIDI